MSGGGGIPYTVRSKFNKFEHVPGRGILYSEVQVQEVWTCLEGKSLYSEVGAGFGQSWGQGVPAQWSLAYGMGLVPE